MWLVMTMTPREQARQRKQNDHTNVLSRQGSTILDSTCCFVYLQVRGEVSSFFPREPKALGFPFPFPAYPASLFSLS